MRLPWGLEVDAAGLRRGHGGEFGGLQRPLPLGDAG